ncbi:MAG TPA: S41 family peptidase [Cyclobacteriaceae bacterium]|nr:S41 family peptidase [Cyclobacteriaceae bacterium]MCB9238660.1 S41 family peptidase [Flammeovirgaceae bacterium]MCO5271818.1 S41 family peptidase [Cyclobacteriaceae bacterium]MCW5901180.1 S41 family peptidase [Cyclobacteriaceae bacterium]HOO09789.1 S41 family peptidase [Cyclobacteriaceae bacterium]
MRKVLIVCVMVVSGVFALSFAPPADRYFEIAKNLDIFASLFKEVNALYVDEVNPNKLIRTGIDAMLVSLDPYTNFIAEDEVETYRTMNTGQYGGIGAATRVIGNRTLVTMIYEGYPAQKNGLKVGDEVVKMDEVELAKLSIEEANQLMRGQVGTTVRLTVKRVGVPGLIDLEFKREKIKVGNVPYYGIVGAHSGYIKLSDFTPDAGKEVKNAVVSLKEQGAKNIILDLRDNPGGLLFEAVNICNIFIPKGKKVVTTKGKVQNSNVTYETLNNPVDLDIPVAVLINRGSASASEIVAGTLQDYDRAVIIGEKSFGKGLVQIPRQLSYNSQVKITTAKYYTPTGRCIQVLDYSHRREDGSVGAIPDSLKQQFKTTNGRIVYDGGGIDPDIAVNGEEVSSLTKMLYANGFIFDYATLYASQHPSIAPAREFTLTDKEYDGFVTWLKAKPYNYRSPVEVELSAFTEQAKKERYYDELAPQIEQVAEIIKESRKKGLYTFKDQIRMLLEQDIASVYYLEKGVTEVGFKNDADIKKSMEVLNAPEDYKRILNLP